MSHGQYGFPFDLLSTEGALKLVPVLAFDTVYLCFEKYGAVQPVLCKHPRDNTGACLIQVNFNKFTFLGNQSHACLIQVACLIEGATMTGFTVM